MAGEDPYVAIVGNDCVQGQLNALGLPCPTGGLPATGTDDGPGAANPFYFAPKHIQFMYDQGALAVPRCFGTIPGTSVSYREGGPGCESFLAQGPVNQTEVCWAIPGTNPGKMNVRVTTGNAGWYEWYIRLPKKPSTQINIVVQCGVLKPNARAVYQDRAIELCAAETGERIGAGVCTRQEVDPGVSPIVNTALPKITAIAYPGPYNDFAPFKLSAWKNPSSYAGGDLLTMANNGNMQLLDGSTNARILLKACMDKTIAAKLPVTGVFNANGEVENDLEAGDLIYVRMDVPRQNTVDIYCHAQSVRLAGAGESPF